MAEGKDFDILNIDDYLETDSFSVSSKAKFGYNDEYFLSETVKVAPGVTQDQVRKLKVYKHFLLQKDMLKMVYLSKRIDKEEYEKRIQEVDNILRMLER